MTAWHRERWRKLYLREPLEQEAWPWHTRGLRNLLIQRAEDDGFVSKSRLALKIALRGDEVFQLAIDTLLEDGFLVENEAGIFVRNLPLAQGDDDEPEADEPSADETPEQRRRRLARARAKRARDAKKGSSASRSERDEVRDEVRTHSVTDSVTERDASRPPLSPSHSPSPHPASQNSQTNQTEETVGSERASVTDSVTERYGQRDAGAYASRVTVRTHSVTERDATTPCPFDLVERARAAGLIASLAKRLKAAEADVEAVAAEFVEFWTVERGGQAQRNWLGKLRAWIETKARAGELRGAGAIASDAETPMHPRAAARIAAQKAEAERVQAELAKTVSDAPRRDMSALVAGIGGDG